MIFEYDHILNYFKKLVNMAAPQVTGLVRTVRSINLSDIQVERTTHSTNSRQALASIGVND